MKHSNHTKNNDLYIWKYFCFQGTIIINSYFRSLHFNNQYSFSIFFSNKRHQKSIHCKGTIIIPLSFSFRSFQQHFYFCSIIQQSEVLAFVVFNFNVYITSTSFHFPFRNLHFGSSDITVPNPPFSLDIYKNAYCRITLYYLYIFR